MSKKRCHDGIGDEDRRIFRLFKIVQSVGRYVFHLVFKWGCNKESTETIEDYLKKKMGMENKDYKNRFDSAMRKTIKSNPSGESYDVSLLFACIKWGCHLTTDPEEWLEGKGTLESMCTEFKNMRNQVCHAEKKIDSDEDMDEMSKKITEVLEKIIKLAGNMYRISDDKMESALKEIKKQINDIMKATLGGNYLLEMEKFREQHKKAIGEIGKIELSEQYRHTSKMDPASFVTEKERLHVKNVFTKLEVIQEDMDKNYEVSYKDLLEIEIEDGKPTVIIVEGDAGAGKTTLTKLILSDWCEKSTIFHGLEQYDLVFYAEGKKKISSYLGLIQCHLPTASYKFDDNVLVSSVLKLKVLLIMDGFDELNKESEKLIKELSGIQIPKSSGCLRLLITTRPSRLIDLCSILNTHSRIKTKLRGIPLVKRGEFVAKLHNEMIKEKQSNQDTQELVNLLKKSQSQIGEHYRLPLNLTLLTYLWATDSHKVNAETTATGLYIAFQELIESRLQNRLMGQLGVAVLPKDKCQEVVTKFQENLYSVCLDVLRSDSMQLSNESEKTLKEKCGELEVPFNEMVEAYLVVEKEWTSSGYKTELTVPHKSIMEFYAANQVMTYINRRNHEEVDKKLISDLMKYGKSEDEILKFLTISKNEDVSLKKIIKELQIDQDLAKYENMFLHLTGLLAHQCPDILHKYSEELLQMLQVAGFKGTKWLDLLVEAKCDEKLACLLVSQYEVQFIIRDGHMRAAMSMFKYLDTDTPVQVILDSEVTYMDDMLCQLSKRDCAVEIFFRHQWKNNKYGSSDERLKSLLRWGCGNQRCSVTKFTGFLETLNCLPESTTDLKIAFATTEHAKKLLVELKDLVEHREISYIGIHVMPEVTADGLLPLPIIRSLRGGECATLWLSKVEGDWQMKCKVIHALLPEGGMFNSIIFPQSNFSAERCTNILTHMKDLNIKVGKHGIRFSSSTISKKQLSDLKMTAKQYFCCPLYCCDESDMW